MKFLKVILIFPERLNQLYQIFINFDEFTFSKKILNFNKLLFKINWKKRLPKTVFFRDYEDLPISSPFDIDILIDLEDREINFLKIIEKLSRQNDLLYFIKKLSHIA